jgi:RNA polymerase sigma factor (sigma-70 family)
MAVHRLAGGIQHLGRAHIPDDCDDGELLGRFVERRDESAFAALVRRHGPMVWGVCRRVVGHHQDAEDAFQAAFLVLARRAAAVRPRRLVANWLYGVASRTALKAKAVAGKRQAREKFVAQLPEVGSDRPEAWAGLDLLIDRELAALPDKYRAAVVLCDLEGQKGKDAARQLGVPEGTLASRLRTGRVLLAKRLTRKGITLFGGALATLITDRSATAGVPAGLVTSTTRAATGKPADVVANVSALTEGVMKAMVLTKLKLVLAGVLVVGVLALAGARHAAAQLVPASGEKRETPSPVTRDAANPPPVADEAAKKAAVPANDATALVSYAVADLVTPIPDVGRNAAKKGDDGTREDWLIRKVTRAVAPDSWQGAGGTGLIRYSQRDKTLVVSNTPAVQARVRYLLETMRRVQDVQVAMEIRVVSLDAACLREVRELIPRLKTGDHAVLNDAEAFALLRKAQDGAGTTVTQAPKVTVFPGQFVTLSLDLGKEPGGAGMVDVRLCALVATDLQRLQLDVKAAVGKADFSSTTWMEDGSTVAQVKRDGAGYRLLVVTPRVIIGLGDEVATPGAVRTRAADKK